jgi:hypothetical protein
VADYPKRMGNAYSDIKVRSAAITLRGMVDNLLREGVKEKQKMREAHEDERRALQQQVIDLGAKHTEYGKKHLYRKLKVGDPVAYSGRVTGTLQPGARGKLLAYASGEWVVKFEDFSDPRDVRIKTRDLNLVNSEARVEYGRMGDELNRLTAKLQALGGWLHEDSGADVADVFAVLKAAFDDGVWDGLPWDDLSRRTRLPKERLKAALDTLVSRGKAVKNKGPDDVVRARVRPGANVEDGARSTLADASPRTVVMSLETLREGAGKILYHVALTANAPKIQAKGILTMQSTNWVRAGDKTRYGGGEIYAFEDERDAHRWAAKMGWELFKNFTSGKVSVVKFTGRGKWTEDKNDPISQAGSHGRWLKSNDPVPAADIIDTTAVTAATWKRPG